MPRLSLAPYLADPDLDLYHGDALTVLRELTAESVHMCVTSPPFFSLRDYGVQGQIGLEDSPDAWAARLVEVFREVRRVLRRDGVMFLECGDSYASSALPGAVSHGRADRAREGCPVHGYAYRDPDDESGDALAFHSRHSDRLPHGCASPDDETDRGIDSQDSRSRSVVGLGPRDAPASSKPVGAPSLHRASRGETEGDALADRISQRSSADDAAASARSSACTCGTVGRWTPSADRSLDRGSWDEAYAHSIASPSLKPKDLIGAPWLLAFALRADGWWLRSCMIWAKPNPMPESVTDRPTTAHSYVFLLAKSARYFYDATAVREPAEWACWGDQTVPKYGGTDTAAGWIKPKTKNELHDSAPGAGQRNLRSVLTIPTEPNGLAVCEGCGAYWERGAPAQHCGQPVVAHYAAFPQRLVEVAVLAGTSERGVCPDCGAPWVRETEKSLANPGNRTNNGQKPRTAERRGFDVRLEASTETTGWRPSCEHDQEPVSATTLDPFLGSGTTALVARRLGRRCVGIELREAYCRMTAHRLAQQSLLTETTR